MRVVCKTVVLHRRQIRHFKSIVMIMVFLYLGLKPILLTNIFKRSFNDQGSIVSS